MKRIHLLKAKAPVSAFHHLTGELASRGERWGWLEWRPEEAPADLGQLASGAEQPGLLRSVKVSAGRQQAIKPTRGTPVLKDVLREHFRGCLVVLVRGEVPRQGDLETPSIEATEESFLVTSGARSWSLSAPELADRLRRPRPFDPI